MKILAFSDLHRDLDAARSLVERSRISTSSIGAGDFASVHEGLEETIGALERRSRRPTVARAREQRDRGGAARSGRRNARVGPARRSGAATGIGTGRSAFFGLGAGIPTTPWDWSFDLDEEEAAERLGACPEGAVLVLHSPPSGHCDAAARATHLGSEAISGGDRARAARVAVCGHIHESWGAESEIGATRVVNLGPEGADRALRPAAGRFPRRCPVRAGPWQSPGPRSATSGASRSPSTASTTHGHSLGERLRRSTWTTRRASGWAAA